MICGAEILTRRKSLGSRRTRWSYAIALSFLGLIAWPAVWPMGTDSFPLSSYPMFAQPRAVEKSLPTVLGVDAQGQRRVLTPELIGGAPWVNMAAKLVRDTVPSNAGSRALCRDVAQRIATAGLPDVDAVEVVTETFNTLRYFAGDRTPLKRHVHARCPVKAS